MVPVLTFGHTLICLGKLRDHDICFGNLRYIGGQLVREGDWVSSLHYFPFA